MWNCEYTAEEPPKTASPAEFLKSILAELYILLSYLFFGLIDRYHLNLEKNLTKLNMVIIEDLSALF